MCELKETMPYSEFVEHIAYYQLAPWGDDWKQTQAIAAAATSASPKFKRIDLKPFFPKQKRIASQAQSPDYIFGFFQQIAAESEARRKLSSGK